MKCYCGYTQSESELLSCASGGLATAFAKAIIMDGGIVYGVRFSDDFCSSEYVKVDKVEDLEQLKGSKYVATNSKMTGGAYVYCDVISTVQSGKQVLFIGLPCKVAALIKILQNKKIEYKNNLITMDIICHGVLPREISQQYIDYLQNKYHSRITNLSLRRKIRGWTPPYLEALFSNGKVFRKPLYETEYGIAFMKYSMQGCYNCKIRGENYKSDITVGDAWGIKVGAIGYNSNGVSVAFVRNNRVDDILHKLPSFELHEASYEMMIKENPRYSTPSIKTEEMVKFQLDCQKHGLIYACRRTGSIKQRIIRLLPDTFSHSLLSCYAKIKSIALR